MEAGCPIRVAIACSFCERWISHINGLRPGIFQLSLGLRDVNRRGHSALVPALRKFQRLFKRGHIRHQQLLFRVERAHLEVIEGEFGMQTQTELLPDRAALACASARAASTVWRTRPNTSAS